MTAALLFRAANEALRQLARKDADIAMEADWLIGDLDYSCTRATKETLLKRRHDALRVEVLAWRRLRKRWERFSEAARERYAAEHGAAL